MKIAVTSEGPQMDSPMDARLGRCPYLIIVNIDRMDFQAIANPYQAESGGVATRVAGLLGEHGVEAVITEQCGPNAEEAMAEAGIRIVSLCAPTVRRAVQAFQEEHGSSVGNTGPEETGRPAETQHSTRTATNSRDTPHIRAGKGAGMGRGRGMGRPRRRRRRCRGSD
jgi:predicted Fe-Mo cluster-binding NifX family protein